ncbi:MAG: hypothetical protein ACREBX_15910, partial [Sphingopyxis sp.]
MSAKPILEKLAILADAAKYDAPCASSGTVKRDSVATRKFGRGFTGSSGARRATGICSRGRPIPRSIAPLLAGAEARVERMREAAVSMANPLTDKWRTRVPDELLLDDDVKTLGDVARAVDRCPRCPLYC